MRLHFTKAYTIVCEEQLQNKMAELGYITRHRHIENNIGLPLEQCIIAHYICI